MRTNDTLNPHEAFDQLERTALSQVGISESEHSSIFRLMDSAAESFGDIAEETSGSRDWRHLTGNIRDVAWDTATPKGRMVLAVGGLARAGWSSKRRSREPRDELYPTFFVDRGELRTPSTLLNTHDLHNPLIAVNNGHMREGYVPGRTLPLCHAIYKRAVFTKTREAILNSMGKMHFHDNWDTYEDYHPIATYLYEALDDPFRMKVVSLAINDAERGDPRTFGFRAGIVLKNTLDAPKHRFTDEEAARIITLVTGKPLQADDYAKYKQARRDAQRKKAEQQNREMAERAKLDSAERTATIDKINQSLHEMWRKS